MVRETVELVRKYSGKNLSKSQVVLSSELKDWTHWGEGVSEDEGGDGEDDELSAMCDMRYKWLWDCIWQGSQSSAPCLCSELFLDKVQSYRKERFVIFKEERVGGRVRVTLDEERVLWQDWTEIKFWRYWGWLVVRTLYLRERYLIRSLMISVEI